MYSVKNETLSRHFHGIHLDEKSGGVTIMRFFTFELHIWMIPKTKYLHVPIKTMGFLYTIVAIHRIRPICKFDEDRKQDFPRNSLNF